MKIQRLPGARRARFDSLRSLKAPSLSRFGTLSPSRESRGFTLIELLVVIAIIGILAGFLLPAITRAQWTARKSKCIAQLHQFDVALQNYRTAYDGDLPPWLSNLYPRFVSNEKLFLCPEDSTKKGKDGGKPFWENDPTRAYVETDDFEGSTADTVDPAAAAVQNHDIKANSYLYEFSCAECSWWTGSYAWNGKVCDFETNYKPDPGIHASGRATLTWREVKEWSINAIGPWTPIVRCYWHTGGSFARQDMVLNLGAATHHIYNSGTTGTEDPQYGKLAWEYTGGQ